MKILWIINTIIPEISEHCGLNRLNDAGWISSALKDLKNHENCEITVCFCDPICPVYGKTENMTYYSFREGSFSKYDTRLEVFFEDLIEKEKPDIIHIFGTEYPHSLSMIKVCKKTGLLDRCIINIQGLISRCAEKYYGGLPASVIYGFSPRDFLKMDNVYFQKKAFVKRGVFEIETLKTARNVIGRTDWDHACVQLINPDINYFHCNESLRDCFYDSQWSYENCEKHSVFFSRGGYPLKGMHHAIKALGDIIKRYPDARIYTTDDNEKKRSRFYRLKHTTYYQLYIKRLIKKYGLADKMVFLGELNGEQMKERYLKSNVFLLCSSLENSSNSLSEAMILGVPCVSSDVGGIKSLINHNTEGFVYPFDEPYMINYYIDKIFSDTNIAKELSKNARAHAVKTHSRELNRKQLMSIYNYLLKNKDEI